MRRASRTSWPFMVQGTSAGGGRRHRSTEEEDLHKACATYLEVVLPPPPAGPFWFHTPNGGKRPKGEAGKLKAMGVKAGFPDLAFLRAVPDASFCIELKPQRGKLSTDQKKVIPQLLTLGIRTYIARSLEDLICILETEGVRTNDVLARERARRHRTVRQVPPPRWVDLNSSSGGGA